MEHQVATKIESEGTIVLHDLPFREGEQVLVVIKTRTQELGQDQSYSLRGLPVEYLNPYDPVAENDWSVLQ